MRELDRRQLLEAGVLGAAAFGAYLAKPVRGQPALSQEALEASIPQSVGPYHASGADGAIIVPFDEIGRRIYDRYIARGYVAPDLPRILLVAAYGATQDYRLQLHRPESCYPSSGWSLGPSRQVMVSVGGAVIPAVTMTAARPGRHEQVLYWTRVGATFPVDRWVARGEILKRVLLGAPADGVILRLSLPGMTGDDAVKVLSDFNRALLSKTGLAGRKLLLGPLG